MTDNDDNDDDKLCSVLISSIEKGIEACILYYFRRQKFPASARKSPEAYFVIYVSSYLTSREPDRNSQISGCSLQDVKCTRSGKQAPVSNPRVIINYTLPLEQLRAHSQSWIGESNPLGQ